MWDQGRGPVKARVYTTDFNRDRSVTYIIGAEWAKAFFVGNVLVGLENWLSG